MSVFSGNIVLRATEMPDSWGKLTSAHGYMIVARDLLPAVEALSILPGNVPTRGCAMLGGHTLECILKSFLSHKGRGRGDLKNKIKHNLEELWKMAYREGLSIPKKVPDWVRILNESFYLRYQEGMAGNVVNAGQTPALIPMANELKDLIKVVEVAVKG